VGKKSVLYVKKNILSTHAGVLCMGEWHAWVVFACGLRAFVLRVWLRAVIAHGVVACGLVCVCVKDVRRVNLNVDRLVESIHLIEKLHKNSLHFTISSSLCIKTLCGNGIDLINEDDRR
jgi:hypothetical protein